MAGASKVDGPNFGLTPRELELTVKAMITMVENNLKPDLEKLAKMANFRDARAAGANWNHTVRKLKSLGGDVGGETDNKKNANNAGGKKRSKPEADDMPQAPPAKRGRKRKTALPTAGEDEPDDQKLIIKGEEGEKGEAGEI